MLLTFLMILASLELLMLPASLLGTDFAAAVKVPNVNRITNSASFVATVGVYNVCVVFPAVVHHAVYDVFASFFGCLS